ncbi:hypothetical protein ASD24_13610 [Paenibacillus sp. Root52]|uniref:hypothetical protein n=1 Tax=Paenibacillus sp. Root52 TaxID=1736552 RepID=UPI0006F31648|nr:hypothetical protein [Paenibacillus sp. Root52]KQY83309.1 hypothetical protein ASD24_13610 [Paenibacillus sp. Root52]
MNINKRMLILVLFLPLIGCSTSKKIENDLMVEQYVLDRGYTIVHNEGIVHEYTLHKKQLVEMPYVQYWSVQDVDPLMYVGEKISTSKFIVSGHPLDENSDYDNPQTTVYVMSSATGIIGGYSYLTHSEMNDGWVYTIDGQTLEQHTGTFYRDWLEQWQDKYK